MGYDRIRIKNMARDIVREARPRPLGVTLLLWFLLADLAALCLLPLMATGFFSVPAGERPPLLPLLLGMALGVGLLLLGLVLQGGYASYTLRLWRQERGAGFADLLMGFFSASQIIGLWGWLLFYTFLWGFPGVMILKVIRDLCDPALATALKMPLPSVWTLPVAAVLFVLYMAERLSRYALALVCLMDAPEAGARQAIERSTRLMAGRRVDLLVFLLSFLGWWLVTALVAGFFVLLGWFLLTLLPGAAAQTDPARALELLVPFQLFGVAAAMPLLLWLTAYMGTAFSGFYAAATAPPFPGLQPPEFRRKDQL